jgi:hypothetical protein
MVVTCEICGRSYDDAFHWTYCPHESFRMRTTVRRADGQSKVCTSIAELHDFLGSMQGE